MKITSTTIGSVNRSESRMNEIVWPAGVCSRLSSRPGSSASTPKITAITVWPMNFALLRRPRLRCL